MQVIEVEGGIDTHSVVQRLEADAQRVQERQIRYQAGQRWVGGLQEMEGAGNTAQALPWKRGGKYLISGGAGGLGLLFARDCRAGA